MDFRGPSTVRGNIGTGVMKRAGTRECISASSCSPAAACRLACEKEGQGDAEYVWISQGGARGS
eukprot:355353-Chlamydomonas_euryale.AAC.1